MQNQPLRSIEKSWSFILTVSWGGIKRRNYIIHSEGLLETPLFVTDTQIPPESILTAFLLPSSSHPHSPLPSQAAVPFFSSLPKLFLSGELHKFSNADQLSFSLFVIPQHGSSSQHQNALLTLKMPSIKQRFFLLGKEEDCKYLYLIVLLQS